MTLQTHLGYRFTSSGTGATRPLAMPSSVHARHFLQHLMDCGCRGQELLVAELEALYADMCLGLGCEPRPWLSIPQNSVASPPAPSNCRSWKGKRGGWGCIAWNRGAKPRWRTLNIEYGWPQIGSALPEGESFTGT